MCEITGFFLLTSDSGHAVHRLANGGLLVHRGPDAFDRWIDSTGTIGLQHYRLAIQDVSPAGAQPMTSANGRYVVVFNGEIYNHFELRERLEKESLSPAWRGHSDTETLLACISSWGIDETLGLCVGMFAFAIYDLAERRLTLARDRLGEKPLYYGFLSGALTFASEVKALRAVAGGALGLHKGALAAYMRLGYIPGPQSIYEGIFRLPPGTTISITSDEVSRAQLPCPEAYWSALALPELHNAQSEPVTQTDALEGLDAVLCNAVKGQMLSDVPLGALLSGGIDSSLIVGMMQAQSMKPVNTFSIGFEGSAFDEAPHARRVAAHLGTCHTELYVNVQDALDLVPSLPATFCEPFADSSQVPTMLVSKLARRHVTVALTGDGGDELFAGYERYFRVYNGFRRIGPMPISLRRAAALVLRHTPLPLINALARMTFRFGNIRNPADRVRKVAEVLASRSPSELNRGLLSLWDSFALLPGTKEVDSVFSRDLPHASSVIEEMMLADTLCYLPDDLLVKVDRSAMASSLETRAPFLDHRVVEYAWGLNLEQKIGDMEGKFLLKKLLDRYVPRPLFNRPKQGFGLPVDGWLQGALRPWAEDMLSPGALAKHDLFDVDLIRTRWKEHVSGSRNWQQHIWTILMFQAWAEKADI